MLSNQTLIGAALLVLGVAAISVDPDAYASPLFYGAMVVVFLATGLAALAPWDAIDRRWGIAVPLIDMVAIVLLRESAPTLGLGLLLVFPVIWIARTFGTVATALGTGFAIVGIWMTHLLRVEPITDRDFASLVILPIVLCFITAATLVAARRSRAKTALLRQHSTTIESALERARRQEQILDQVINAVDFGVIAFDRDHTVRLQNRAQRRIVTDFGGAPGAVVIPVAYQADGITPFTDDDRPFARALAGHSFSNVIMWAGEPGGRRAAFSVSSRVVHDERGEYDGGVLVVQDVTKELEAVRARDDLVGSVSHELRSPLTSVLGYIDLARDDEGLDADTRRMLDIASSNAERLLVLVTDLLRTASDAGKQLEMSFVPCDLVAIARDSVESHQVLAEEREVELVLDGEPTAPAVADPVRIRQVIDNLVTNAIKYNLEWGSVTVTVGSEADGVVIQVRDTGQGIPEADLPRIFDRFYRTSAARTSATVGTGLGLAIARDIVHRHGGDLTVSSELGIGTTFRLTIPTGHRDVPEDTRKEPAAT